MTRDDSMTPHGVLERMKLDMEMEAVLYAAYNMLTTTARRFGNIEGEEWRNVVLRQPLIELRKAIDLCPSNSMIQSMIDDRALAAYNEWYPMWKAEQEQDPRHLIRKAEQDLGGERRMKYEVGILNKYMVEADDPDKAETIALVYESNRALGVKEIYVKPWDDRKEKEKDE